MAFDSFPEVFSSCRWALSASMLCWMRSDMVLKRPFVCRPVSRPTPAALERVSGLLLDGEVLRELDVGLRRRLVLRLDRAPELLAVDGDGLRRVDADADA